MRKIAGGKLLEENCVAKLARKQGKLQHVSPRVILNIGQRTETCVNLVSREVKRYRAEASSGSGRFFV